MDREEPLTVNVRNFVASRIQEIKSLTAQIAAGGRNPTTKGLAFQHVPKHMRRRAVSHNPKRVPGRLRQVHISQATKSAGSIKKKPKRPSRKFRRRKSNLLLEYNRRQQKIKWIETHIWHAKRFHMDEKWGWKIPRAPCDKGYRSLYRSLNQNCAMRDMSFYSCLELTGPFEVIKNVFERNNFFPKEVNQIGVGAVHLTSGLREGHFHFYKGGLYPSGYVGKVSTLWKMDQSSLWIWTHPSFKEDIISELVDSFDLLMKHSAADSHETVTNEDESQKMSIDMVKLLPKAHRLTWSSDSVRLTDLEGALNRIRLYGRMSTAILKQVLFIKSNNFGDKDSRRFWWQGIDTSVFERQTRAWDAVKFFSDVPCHAVVPLTVRDPRVFLPQQKGFLSTKDVRQTTEMPERMQIEDSDQSEGTSCQNLQFQDSPLWDSELRNRIIDEKMTDAEYAKKRSLLLIPGSQIDLKEEENQIPILLVQRPHPTSLTSCSSGGWDIIIPGGWTMSFWIALSYRSVRSCGERDAAHFEFESGSIHKDEFFSPDSSAGTKYSLDRADHLKEEYFKLPPAKRPNYIKLGSPFPFSVDWKSLLSLTTNEPAESFSVIRDIKVLHNLTLSLMKQNCGFTMHDAFKTYLVGVRVVIYKKGTVEEGAMICIPEQSDLTESMELLCEPAHDDMHQQEREQLRVKHQKFMAFLRKKRKKWRKNESEDAPQVIKSYDSSQVSLAFNKTMNCLWMPKPETLGQLIRSPIGFVVTGSESYAVGKCVGLGYCSLVGLINWISVSKDWNGKRLVLIRCKDSDVYRLAKIQICPL